MNILKTTLSKAALILILLTATLTNCSSSDDSPSSGDGNYFLSAKIDGVDFSANSENASVSALADLTPIYTIIGTDADGGQITLMLQSPITVGTFDASPNQDLVLGSAAFMSYKSPNDEVFSISDGIGPVGIITITNNNDNSVEGTFTFTGESHQSDETKVFSDGQFKAKKL